MNRKLLTIVTIIIFILMIGTIQSLAVDIAVFLQGQTTVSSTDDTVELVLSLGNFTDIEEGIPLGYQSTINYDEEVFSGISVEGLSGWTVSYEDSTKVLVGEIDSAVANTDITLITLTLQDGIADGTTGTIYFNNLLLTDGENDITVDLEFTITIEDSDDEENSNTNTESGNTIVNTTNTSATNTDTTTSSKTLPAAGVTNILIMAIVIVVMILLAVIFNIKSRKVKY